MSENNSLLTQKLILSSETYHSIVLFTEHFILSLSSDDLLPEMQDILTST